MPFTTNIQEFQAFPGSALVESYLILIAIELALKDRGAKSGDGHDVPGLLTSLLQFPKISKHPKLPGELTSYIAQLRSSLQAIWCTDQDGNPKKVPSNSYPYLRYCRCYSEWNGNKETKTADILTLNATCKSLRDFLRRNIKTIEVKV
jgi:hypothetical protein